MIYYRIHRNSSKRVAAGAARPPDVLLEHQPVRAVAGADCQRVSPAIVVLKIRIYRVPAD